MKINQWARGNAAIVRAGLLLGGCAGLVAACSSDDSAGVAPQAGAGGVAGSAQAGKGSGGAQGGKAGASQGGKGGNAGGGMTSTAGHAGEGGTSAGDGPGASAGAGGESAAGHGSGGEAGAGASGACIQGEHCDSGDGCELASACQANVCTRLDPQLAPVDQQQLGDAPDTWNVFESEKIGQLITAGKTGLLAGVELSLAVAASANVGSLQLNVYDMNSALLGKGSVAMSALAGQSGGKLIADQIGAAFFDLSSQCIHVTAAQKLRIELHLVGVPGTCVADHCSGGPAANSGCTGDALCTGITISASQPSTYAGGSITFGTNAGSPDDNLNFKTFVVE